MNLVWICSKCGATRPQGDEPVDYWAGDQWEGWVHRCTKRGEESYLGLGDEFHALLDRIDVLEELVDRMAEGKPALAPVDDDEQVAPTQRKRAKKKKCRSRKNKDSAEQNVSGGQMSAPSSERTPTDQPSTASSTSNPLAEAVKREGDLKLALAKDGYSGASGKLSVEGREVKTKPPRSPLDA